ncbi:MAG: methyltransferase [Alphaproteobacteria bacterium]|nr:methyltransferase [Alphaproteobacteria bacterium]
MTTSDGVAALSEQYETFPYPPRDPKDEAQRLITGSPSQLAELNHYIFGGRRDFFKPFRALVAGGGTGDAAIMLAQQLADTGGPGEVIYLDHSAASRNIAEGRAKARGLKNITFHSGSLLDIAAIAPGPYDYIDCCGVLHHLPDPSAGLKALYDVLADDGGMGLMVYAPYGRAGVYQTQAMLRSLEIPNEEPTQRVKTARALLEDLPQTNELRRNPLVGDHLNEGDAGLYDLLLHSQDRAYTVSELAEFVADARMSFAAFIAPFGYDPSLHIKNSDILNRLNALTWIERCAFAEKLTCSQKTHIFYTTKKTRGGQSIAQVGDLDLAPVLVGLDAKQAAAALRKSGQLNAELEGLKLSFAILEDECTVLELMNGKHTRQDILNAVTALRADMTPESFDAAYDRLFRVLNGLNLAFLQST